MMLRPMRPNPLIPTLMAILPPVLTIPRIGLRDQGPSTRRSARGENANSSLNYPVINILPAVYALYSVLIVTFFLVMSPYLAWQAVRYRKYIGSLGQRLGYLPISFNLDGEESISIHSVSVGEELPARPILPPPRQRHPGHRPFLSQTPM